MKIAISGANGYIGKNIINELTRLNTKIIQINRKLLYADPQILSNYISGCHAVINLAGAPILKRWTLKNRVIIYNSRVLTTTNLCCAINKLAENKQPKIFISASATGIYRKDKCHTESSSVYENNFPSRVIDDWEDASLILNQNIRRVIFRIGIVLGKESQTITKLLPAFKLELGAIIGNGKQAFPFIHIQDVCKAFIQAVNIKSYSGIYNLVAPNLINNKTFTKALAESVHRLSFSVIPLFLLKLTLGKSAQLIYDSPHIIPNKLNKLKFKFDYPTIESVLNEITKKKRLLILVNN